MSSSITSFSLNPFFKLTPDLVCFANKAGYFKKINHSVVEKLGYTEEELMSRPIASFIHPDDREITGAVRRKLIEGEALVNFENRYVNKAGEIIWLHWTSIYFPDDEVVFAIAKDISKRKTLEIELEAKYEKFKKLTTHFKGNVESDRKYFSLELHEDIAQLASVIRMDLEAINNDSESMPAHLKQRVDHAMAVTEMMKAAIKKISLKISSYLRDELSLIESLQWLCNDFSHLASIPCNIEAEFDEQKLSPEVKQDIFRICQEALSNVMHHAEASEVKMKCVQNKNVFSISISDNGKGFDLQNMHHTPGLISMQERATSVNAYFSIDTAPGKGTCVMLEAHNLS